MASHFSDKGKRKVYFVICELCNVLIIVLLLYVLYSHVWLPRKYRNKVVSSYLIKLKLGAFPYLRKCKEVKASVCVP